MYQKGIEIFTYVQSWGRWTVLSDVWFFASHFFFWPKILSFFHFGNDNIYKFKPLILLNLIPNIFLISLKNKTFWKLLTVLLNFTKWRRYIALDADTALNNNLT